MNADDAAQDAEQHFKAIGCEIACPICLSYFDDPYSTPCHHVFCHSCIQKAISVKQQCPVCKFPVWRRSLNQNPILAHIVEHYSKLERLLEDSKSSSSRFPIGVLCGGTTTGISQQETKREKDCSVDSLKTSTSADAFTTNPVLSEREVNRVDVDVIRTYLHEFLECVAFADDCLASRKKSIRSSSASGRRRTRESSSPSSLPTERTTHSRSKVRKTAEESRKDAKIEETDMGMYMEKEKKMENKTDIERGVDKRKGKKVLDGARRASTRAKSKRKTEKEMEEMEETELEEPVEDGDDRGDDRIEKEKAKREGTRPKNDRGETVGTKDLRKGKATGRKRGKQDAQASHDDDDVDDVDDINGNGNVDDRDVAVDQEEEEAREMVICRKMLSVRDRKQLDHLAHNGDAKVKARVVDDILEDASHLVVKVNAEGRCKRTSSYIVALWRDVHIVSDLWVRMSSEAGCWMDLEPFIVRGDDQGVDGVRLREQYALQSIFDGKPRIGFFGSIHIWPRPHLRAAVECGGGQVIDPVTFPLKKFKPTPQDPLIVVYEGDPQTIKKHARTRHVSFAPVQWLIEVLSTFVWIEPNGYSIDK
eukprot:TRINITY_DN24982_c0_g1_i1.p1 TRINITY_DN24982_c0_g1~~TRINITY_DN24982_c0_g1_i1.p1  ORF type:complete len:591 (-),score=151.49 TRINITY_DN24982_c0_g1_i1:41-1813(-)